MALSGCPGCGQIGPLTLRPLTSISMMSPVTSPDFFAWLGLMSTPLSQQKFMTGFGVSCSQALLARLPSKISGSGRNMTSMAFAPTPFVAGISPPFGATVFAGSAVFAMKPSFSALRHAVSKSPPFIWSCQYLRTMS